MLSMRSWSIGAGARARVGLVGVVVAVLLGSGGGAAQEVHVVTGSSHVMTYHNDNARTGRYDQETVLAGKTPAAAATVDKAVFGKLPSMPVDGDVYAQPLFLAGVPIGGRNVDVVYAATEHDSVYAFEAGTGKQLWKKSFLVGAGVTTITQGDVDCGNIAPEIGITGTPVIGVTDDNDLTTATIYFVAKTKEPIAAGGFACVQRLHAIDAVKGEERSGEPDADRLAGHRRRADPDRVDPRHRHRVR